MIAGLTGEPPCAAPAWDIPVDGAATSDGGGGSVFSVGSIAWTASLSHAGYANNVARVTGNVLREFTRRGAAADNDGGPG